MADATPSAGCKHCGTPLARKPYGPPPVYCSGKCRAAAKRRRDKATGKNREYAERVKARRDAERLANARPCPYCGELMTNLRRVQCGAPECKKAWVNERQREWYQAYKERTGERYNAQFESQRTKPRHAKTCEHCGRQWTSWNKDARYCDKSCYAKANLRVPKPLQLEIRFPVEREPGLRELFLQGRFEEALACLLARTERLESGCRVLKGRHHAEYPEVYWEKGTRRPAHRLVLWAKTAGPIDGWQAHHVCANSACVEPEHIVPATAAQNMAEMLARKTLEAEIAMLRAALAEHAPDHPLIKGSRDLTQRERSLGAGPQAA